MPKPIPRAADLDEQTDDRLSRYAGSARDSTQPWYETMPIEDSGFEPEPPRKRLMPASFLGAAALTVGVGAVVMYVAVRLLGL